MAKGGILTVYMCSSAVLLAAAAVAIYAFMVIFGQKKSDENDLEVLQRQLKGFALLMVSSIVLSIGSSVCEGANIVRQVERVIAKF